MTRILFQLNLAKMRTPFNDSLFDDFKEQLESLHTLAESNLGFLWRYRGEKDEGGFIKPYTNAPLIMGNMSAWSSYRALYEYTFSSAHLAILKEKRKWFERMPVPYTVLYYGVMEDLLKPDIELLDEAKRRLSYLSVHGETTVAFGFGSHNGVL